MVCTYATMKGLPSFGILIVRNNGEIQANRSEIILKNDVEKTRVTYLIDVAASADKKKTIKKQITLWKCFRNEIITRTTIYESAESDISRQQHYFCY